MGIFSNKTKSSFGERKTSSELNARIKSVRQRSGFADEAINEYKRGRASAEDVRRELSRHDKHFTYTEPDDLKKML